eukprot:gb/GECG01012695.1/.p1 GENE.gb/GECG01012695.1/~~gb/GECG01012695.1/.p1  ORF type:complete len:105 (+),score=11.39 gb/GECG01012695.1/:1-315(+)
MLEPSMIIVVCLCLTNAIVTHNGCTLVRLSVSGLLRLEEEQESLRVMRACSTTCVAASAVLAKFHILDHKARAHWRVDHGFLQTFYPSLFGISEEELRFRLELP